MDILSNVFGNLVGAWLAGLLMASAPESAADQEAERLYRCPVEQIVIAMPANKPVCLVKERE